jgi:hypothetical protein
MQIKKYYYDPIDKGDNSSYLSKCIIHRKGNGDTGEDRFRSSLKPALAIVKRAHYFHAYLSDSKPSAVGQVVRLSGCGKVYMAYGVSPALFGSEPACVTDSLSHRDIRQLQVTPYQATRGAGHVLPSPTAHPGVGGESRYVRNWSSIYAQPRPIQAHPRHRPCLLHQPRSQRLLCHLAIYRREHLYPHCIVCGCQAGNSKVAPHLR